MRGIEVGSFDGICLILNWGKKVFLFPIKKGYRATVCTRIKNGIRDNNYHTGDLNDPRNLEGFFNFVHEALKEESCLTGMVQGVSEEEKIVTHKPEQTD